jgi:hypothetical protein
MPFVRYDQDPSTGAYTFVRDDGAAVVLPQTPASYREAKRLDMEGALLAQNASTPPELMSRAAPAPGSDAGSGTRQPAPSPSVLDAGPPLTPAPQAPGYTPAPPPPENVSLEPAGAGGAPSGYNRNVEGAGAAGGAGPVPEFEPPPPADGGGGAKGGPQAEVPTEAPPQAQGGQPAAGGAQGGVVKTVPFAGPAAPRPAAGGGGRPAGPQEMLAGRTVQIEGRLGPERQRELEGVIQREADLAQRSAVRNEERQNLDIRAEEGRDKLAKNFDDDLVRIQQEKQRALDDLAERRAAKMREIEEGQIDPQRLWQGGRGTQNAIAAGLAVALGAVGAALAGGPNLGLQAVTKAIDRDLDLQEKELNKKQGELSELGKIMQAEEKRFGDKIVARNEAKIAALTAAKAQAERYAKIANSEDAMIKLQGIQLEADKRIAALRAENDGRIKEVKQYKTVMPGGGGAPKKQSGGFVIRDPKTGKDRFIEFPPGLSDGQKNDVFKRVQGINNAQRTLGRLQQARGLGLPIASGDAEAFAQSFTYEYAEGKGQGQATADQEKSVASKVSGPLGYKAIDAYSKNLDDSAEELIRQFSVREDR